MDRLVFRICDFYASKINIPANKALELTKEGKYVIFGFEEAIGYMCGLQVADKDGVSAACHMSTLGSFLKSQNTTLNEKLDEIYNTYGYHVSLNSYYICYYAHVIKDIFDKIRNFVGPRMVINFLSFIDLISCI